MDSQRLETSKPSEILWVSPLQTRNTATPRQDAFKQSNPATATKVTTPRLNNSFKSSLDSTLTPRIRDRLVT
jgi:hypothetical protein